MRTLWLINRSIVRHLLFRQMFFVPHFRRPVNFIRIRYAVTEWEDAQGHRVERHIIYSDITFSLCPRHPKTINNFQPAKTHFQLSRRFVFELNSKKRIDCFRFLQRFFTIFFSLICLHNVFFICFSFLFSIVFGPILLLMLLVQHPFDRLDDSNEITGQRLCVRRIPPSNEDVERRTAWNGTKTDQWPWKTFQFNSYRRTKCDKKTFVDNLKLACKRWPIG